VPASSSLTRRLTPPCVAGLIAVLIGGCGSSSPHTITTVVRLRTQTGIRYNAEVTLQGARECTFQTYGVIAPHVKPYTTQSRDCVDRHGPVRPRLIQIAKPSTALILDRPAHGCQPVQVTAGRAHPVTVTPTCSTTKPTLRITALPRGGTLRIAGIAGVTRIALRDYPCHRVCSRPISGSG
jgi:hypothetical protein